MPGLRERLSDVSELSEHFLGLVADREGGRRKRLAKDALVLFENYTWPGNVRELQNLCERAAVLASGETISAELVAPWLVATTGGATSTPSGGVATRLVRPMSEPPTIETFADAANALIGVPSNGASSSVAAFGGDGTGLPSLVCDGDLTLDEIERRSIVATLERFRGHRQKSAKALGIGVRTLGLKLKKWKEESLVPAEL